MSAQFGMPIDPLDHARAQEYMLLSTLLLRSPDPELIGSLALLAGDPTALGMAHAALGQAAARVGATRAGEEFHDLFIGVGRGELLPYASYYRTGFVSGLPLARLRQSLRQLGAERAPGQAEPEDHAALLLQVMAGFASGTLAAPLAAEREFFDVHVAPWMGRFFVDLERAETADFYGRVGALGRTFIDIEAEAFTLAE